MEKIYNLKYDTVDFNLVKKYSVSYNIIEGLKNLLFSSKKIEK